MASLGVQLPVLAAVLNQSPGQVIGITAVYNRHRYSQEKRDALQSWADHVEQLVGIDQRDAGRHVLRDQRKRLGHGITAESGLGASYRRA
jgi:hypothetical protein